MKRKILENKIFSLFFHYFTHMCARIEIVMNLRARAIGGERRCRRPCLTMVAANNCPDKKIVAKPRSQETKKPLAGGAGTCEGSSVGNAHELIYRRHAKEFQPEFRPFLEDYCGFSQRISTNGVACVRTVANRAHS
jgi:hypothetical protein